MPAVGSDPGGLFKAYQQLFEAIKEKATPSGLLMSQLGAMAGGALVADDKERVSPETVDELDKLMLERLKLLMRRAERIESSDIETAERDSQRQVLIEELRRVLRLHKAVLERLQDEQDETAQGKGKDALQEKAAAAISSGN